MGIFRTRLHAKFLTESLKHKNGDISADSALYKYYKSLYIIQIYKYFKHCKDKIPLMTMAEGCLF